MNIKQKMLFSSLIALAGCSGGGSGSSSEEAPQAVPAVVETAPSSPTPIQVARTSDLVADQQFGFTSSYSVDVNVMLDSGDPAYLNICRDYEGDSGGYEIDYGSCLLQTALANGVFTGRVTLTNDVDELVIAVWPLTGVDATYHLWRRQTEGDQITIN